MSKTQILLFESFRLRLQPRKLFVRVREMTSGLINELYSWQPPAEKRNNVLNWLDFEDPTSKHVEVTNKRHKGTGEWLLRAPEFQQWYYDYENPYLVGLRYS